MTVDYLEQQRVRAGHKYIPASYVRCRIMIGMGRYFAILTIGSPMNITIPISGPPISGPPISVSSGFLQTLDRF